MLIGHINLAKSFNSTGEHLVSLIEALQGMGVNQHVLVRNVTLAKHLDAVDGIVVGPVVRSAVTANCLMPKVDLVHIHDSAAAQTGLLMTLTRSIPYVLSYPGIVPNGRNPLAQTIYRRALCIICRDDCDASILRHYDQTLHLEIIPEMERHGSAAAYLRLYQNSQRMPIAGSKGIQ